MKPTTIYYWASVKCDYTQTTEICRWEYILKIAFSLFTLVLQSSGIGFLYFASFGILLSTCLISKSHHLWNYIYLSKKLVIVSLSPEVFAKRLFYLISFCQRGQFHSVNLSSISMLFVY